MSTSAVNSYPDEHKTYVKIYKRHISSLGERTQNAYLYELSRFLRFCSKEGIEPSKAGLLEIEDFFEELYSQKGTKIKSKKPPSKNQSLAALSKFYETLINHNYEDVKFNPIDRIPKVKRERNKKPIFLTAEQMIECMAAAEGIYANRNIAMFALMGYCGLRVSEVSKLNLEDYNREECKIKIIGKGNKHNEIPLPEGLIKILNRYLEERLKPYKYKENAMFISHHYRRITVRGIQKVIQKMYLNKYGIYDEKEGKYVTDIQFTAHKLRHSYATMLMLSGVDIRVVKELMGHSSIETTAIYSHVVDSQKEEAVKRLVLQPIASGLV